MYKVVAVVPVATAPAGASPRDVGPAARAFPDLTFVVYHSGYEQPGARDDVHAHGGLFPSGVEGEFGVLLGYHDGRSETLS